MSSWMPLNGPWQFDALSALIGAGAGLIAGAGAAYALRKRLEGTVQSAREQAEHARDRLTMGTQQRYLEWLEGRVNALHILREGASLAELYVEPELVSPPPRPAVSNKPVETPPTVPLAVALKAAPRLIVTGAPGSGRTALLAHVARTLAQAMHQSQTALGLPEHTLPVYLHFHEMNLEPVAPPSTDPNAKPVKPDPFKEPINALAERMPLLIETPASSLVEKAVKAGDAILLLDGFDELDAEGRTRALAWLKALCEDSPKLRIVIPALPGQYTPLVELGFTAIPLARWTSKQVTQLAERWMRAAQATEQDAERLAAILKPAPGTLPLPLDVMLTAFVWQKRQAVPPNRAAAFSQAVDLALESVQAASPLSPLLARTALGKLALAMLSEGRFTAQHAEIEKNVTALLAPPATQVEPPAPAAPPEAPAEAPQAQDASQAAPAPASKPPEPPKPKGVPESVDALLKCGLLIERAKDRITFAHRRIQAYLAAWEITQEGSGTVLAQHLDDVQWADVFEFCAGLVNITPLVDVLLKRDASAEEGDLFHTRLWTLADWAASAGPEATWRGKVLAQVAAQLMQPHQLPPLRERATMALLATQDKGLGYVFKQALASPDAHLRMCALSGLGKLGREQDMPMFEAALQDPDGAVREQAVRAMANVGSKEKIEHLASVLLSAEEAERRVAALMLAECPPDGWNILREAVKEEDMLVRRAATYGLAATRQDWARDLLTQLERGDPQWFVRSATTEALAAMKASAEYTLDCSPIVLDQQGWLVEWAAARGIPLGLGRNAEPVLMRALNEGDTPVRVAAIHALAHLGTEAHIETLRAQLSMPEPEIQDAAYQALQAIGDRLGVKIKRS